MPLDKLQQLVITSLEDGKAENLVILDVSAASSVTDCMIIATGKTSRQVNALARNLEQKLKQENIEHLGIEGLDAGEWVLLDLGDLVVHLMQPATRDFYALEELWGDFAQTQEQQA